MPTRSKSGRYWPSSQRLEDGERAHRWDEREAVIIDALGDLRDLAALAVPWGSAPGGLGLVDVVRGSAGVWQAFWLHADLQARPQVDAIIPDLRPLIDVLSGDASEEWADVQALVTSGEVRIRLILPLGVESTMASVVVDRMVSVGIDVRLADASSWYFVSSQGVAAAPLTWAEAGDTDVAVVRGGPIVGALTELFELRWRGARAWVHDEHEAVLRLCAAGLGDEDVARELGTSVRTVRRRVAEAMEAYGASNRFELGYRYANR
jgi:hypothetical protein